MRPSPYRVLTQFTNFFCYLCTIDHNFALNFLHQKCITFKGNLMVKISCTLAVHTCFGFAFSAILSHLISKNSPCNGCAPLAESDRAISTNPLSDSAFERRSNDYCVGISLVVAYWASSQALRGGQSVYGLRDGCRRPRKLQRLFCKSGSESSAV